MKAPFKAIAAMSLDRVIGAGGSIPWHIPEDFRWFKKITMGHILLMGRKTYESIGRPLPGRETVVLSRSGASCPGAAVIASVDARAWEADGRTVFVCGGGEIYRQLLPVCSELYLSVVKRTIGGGDAFFPAHETDFVESELLYQDADFRLARWERQRPA